MDKPSSPSPNVVQAAEFESRLLGQIPFSPTESQERFAHVWSRFVVSDKPGALILRGYAGTGKTTAVGAVVRTLRDADKMCAVGPTGRAAKVLPDMQGKTLQPSTTHLSPKAKSRGRHGVRPHAKPSANTLFIVDEASMIGESGGFHLGVPIPEPARRPHPGLYSGHGCRLMLIEDDAQLPPVGASRSPPAGAQTPGGFRPHLGRSHPARCRSSRTGQCDSQQRPRFKNTDMRHV